MKETITYLKSLKRLGMKELTEAKLNYVKYHIKTVCDLIDNEGLTFDEAIGRVLKTGDKFQKKERQFTVPFMVLHREDLAFMDTERVNISKKLSDEQMQRIADKLGSVLAEEWDMILSNFKAQDPSLFEVE